MPPILGSEVNGGSGFVTIWTKGFRVSEDTEEFQRVVPVRSGDLSLEVERDVDAQAHWVEVLEPLYKLSEYELALQKCLIVRPGEAAVVAVGRSEDRHGRTTPVVLCIAITVNWSSPELGKTVSAGAVLASRLCSTYSRTFKRNPPAVLEQLRSAQFVADRRFELEFEGEQSSQDWSAIMATIKKWRGIQGVATPKLIGLGANVLIGTKHEADRSGVRLDGVIDPQDWSLTPLNGNLTLWHQPRAIEQNIHKESQGHWPPSTGDSTLESISASLHRIDDSLVRLSRAATGLYHVVLQTWFPPGGNRRR